MQRSKFGALALAARWVEARSMTDANVSLTYYPVRAFPLVEFLLGGLLVGLDLLVKCPVF